MKSMISSRRAILAGAAVLPALAASAALANSIGPIPVATVAVASPSIAEDDAVELLWRHRCALKAALKENTAQYEQACSKLPRWADVGPRMIDSEGNYVGKYGTCGWPEMAKVTLPSRGAMRQVRWSPDDAKEAYKRDIATGMKRSVARARYREFLSRINARLREQRKEQRKLGILKIDAEGDRISNEMISTEDQIANLAMQPGSAASALVCHAMIEFEHEQCHHLVRAILTSSRPGLPSEIGSSADAVLAEIGEYLSQAGVQS